MSRVALFNTSVIFFSGTACLTYTNKDGLVFLFAIWEDLHGKMGRQYFQLDFLQIL